MQNNRKDCIESIWAEPLVESYECDEMQPGRR